MMRFFLSVFFLASIIFASDGDSFGEKKRVYTIQLFSLMKNYPETEIINKIPLHLRDEIHLHRVKKQTVACYSQASNYSEIKSKLQKVKKAGYKNAYIITTTKWTMPHKEKHQRQRLSKEIPSQVTVKSDKAYKNGDKVRKSSSPSVGVQNENIDSKKRRKIYTIQLFTLTKKYPKKEIINKIPPKLRDEVHLHAVADRKTVACYSQASNYSEIKSKLQKVKKAGYKNAYIITTRKWTMPHKEKHQKQRLSKDTPSQVTAKVNKREYKKQKLSKFVISKMIVKANKAYKSGDEMQAMIIYEMLLSAGVKSQRIKNNLCYLYGKHGAWNQAKDVIQKERHQSKLLYAYAKGAVITSQKNFYKNLKEYILLDRSGHLALLAGYYFEQKNQMKRAFDFYKMAYDKNRSDLYNIYAYARSLDMLGKHQMATQLYKKLLLQTKEGSDIYKQVKSRVYK